MTVTSPHHPELSIREMYEDAGLSIKTIAEIKGCSYTAIRNRLLAYNVKLRAPGAQPDQNRLPHEEYQKVALLYGSGFSTNEIAKMLGVAEDTVNNRLRRHGVQLRSRSESLKIRFARIPKGTQPTSS